MLREWRAACAFSAQTSVSRIIVSSSHLGRQQCEQCPVLQMCWLQRAACTKAPVCLCNAAHACMLFKCIHRCCRASFRWAIMKTLLIVLAHLMSRYHIFQGVMFTGLTASMLYVAVQDVVYLTSWVNYLQVGRIQCLLWVQAAQ